MTIYLTRFKYVAVLLLVFALLACTKKLTVTEGEKNLVVFPAPPDTTRIQFLTSISSSLDVTGKRSTFLKYVLGEESGKPIRKPYGIEVHNEKIYICDSMLPGLEIINLEQRTFDYFTPTGLGQLKKPLNCALDKKDNLYIADAGRKQVLFFNNQGIFESAVADENLVKPTDVLIHQDKLWVCDLEAHQIKVFDLSTFNPLFIFPDTLRHQPQYLFSPTNLAAHGDKIYVTDTGDARVKVFNTNGEYLNRTGGFGKQPGKFARPKGLAVDASGHLYVVDAAFENVQLFGPGANLLMYFGNQVEGPGQMWLPAGVALDQKNLDYFQQYVYHGFDLKHLIFVANQYGPAKINIYGFVHPKPKIK